MKTVRFISLISTALLAGLLFCHALELPNKLTLPAEIWLAVQQHLYSSFGPVASVIEPLAILSTVAAAIMVRHDRTVFGLTLIAALCLVGHLAEWFLVVNPVNLQVHGWTPSTLPPDWMAARLRWEWGHACGAVLAGIALVSLTAALLYDTPSYTLRSRSVAPRIR